MQVLTCIRANNKRKKLNYSHKCYVNKKNIKLNLQTMTITDDIY